MAKKLAKKSENNETFCMNKKVRSTIHPHPHPQTQTQLLRAEGIGNWINVQLFDLFIFP